MGTVYRARQISLDRTVALKVLSSDLISDPKYTDSFLREAKAAARLRHANTISVFDSGKADDSYYYAMELIEGETLSQWVKRDGRIPEPLVCDIGICVASALKNGWDKETLLHRDVKPENIMVDRDGNVKLCDLGLAKYFGENTLLSLSGKVFGTPNYMSPEQARAERGMDFRTDIYALGLTLYFAVTGEIPFHGGNATQVMARKLTEQLPDPREFAPETSAHFCRMLEKMTAQEVEHRYASWDDVLRDLHLVKQNSPPANPAGV
jgi:serine/threonine-protein kinase